IPAFLSANPRFGVIDVVKRRLGRRETLFFRDFAFLRPPRNHRQTLTHVEYAKCRSELPWPLHKPFHGLQKISLVCIALGDEIHTRGTLAQESLLTFFRTT